MRKKDPLGPFYCITKPDRDNLDKAIMDTLTDIGMWVDDALVCDGRIRKFYHGKEDQAGAFVKITKITSVHDCHF